MKPVNRTKVNVIKVTLLSIGIVLLMGCNSSSVTIGDVKDKPSVSVENNQIEAVFTADGLSHEPYGWDNLYGSKEVPSIWWERSPRDPVEGDVVEIVIAAWKDTADMDIWLEWSLNGEAMEVVPCKHKANLDDFDQKKGKYVGELGSFMQGDKVQYSIFAGNDGIAKKRLGPYSFSVFKWETLKEVNGIEEVGDAVVLLGESDSLKPNIYLRFLENGTLEMNVEPLEEKADKDIFKSSSNVTVIKTEDLYKVTDGNLTLEVGKNPYGFLFKDSLVTEYWFSTRDDCYKKVHM